jgi:hypothetical protein
VLALLAAAGSTSGTVEAWDPRSRTQAAILNVTGSSPDRAGAEVTALRYHQGPLTVDHTSHGSLCCLDSARAAALQGKVAAILDS